MGVASRRDNVVVVRSRALQHPVKRNRTFATLLVWSCKLWLAFGQTIPNALRSDSILLAAPTIGEVFFQSYTTYCGQTLTV